jgi:hypothetical protein
VHPRLDVSDYAHDASAIQPARRIGHCLRHDEVIEVIAMMVSMRPNL